jgi:putative chitinase
VTFDLRAAGVEPGLAEVFAAPLESACKRFEIDTPKRIAAFLGQCLVESTGFRHLEENLTYSTADRIRAIFPSRVTSPEQAALLVRNPQALANCVYAGKNGNGNPITGDGWRYRGRGLIQLTGRANYADAAMGLNRPYLDDPDLLAKPEDACLTAAWYWHNIKANHLADAGEIDSITRAVNGRAMLHAELRRTYTANILKAL